MSTKIPRHSFRQAVASQDKSTVLKEKSPDTLLKLKSRLGASETEWKALNLGNIEKKGKIGKSNSDIAKKSSAFSFGGKNPTSQRPNAETTSTRTNQPATAASPAKTEKPKSGKLLSKLFSKNKK